MIPPSLLIICQGWELIDLPLRASNEHLLSLRVPRVISQGWGLMDFPLRVSNEGSPRPRVARAREIHQSSSPSPFP